MTVIIKKFFENDNVLVFNEDDLPWVWDITQIQQDVTNLENNKADKIQNNYEATTNPTVNDDVSEWYSVWSIWYNLTDQEAFICIDAIEWAAVWIKTTLTIDELGSMAFESTDNYYDKTEVDWMVWWAWDAPLFIQDTEPSVTVPSLWIDTTWWNFSFNLVTP